MSKKFSINDDAIKLPDSPVTGSLYAKLLMEMYEVTHPVALLVNHEILVLRDSKDGFFNNGNRLGVGQQRSLVGEQEDTLYLVTSNAYKMDGTSPYTEKNLIIKDFGNRLDIQVISDVGDVELLISTQRKIEHAIVVSRQARSDLLRYKTLVSLASEDRGRLMYWKDEEDSTLFTIEESACYEKYFGRDPMSFIYQHASVKGIDYNYTKEGDEGLTYD